MTRKTDNPKIDWFKNNALHCKKRCRFPRPQPGCHQPNSPLCGDITAEDGKIKTFFLQCTGWRHIRISLVSDILAGDGEIGNIFYSVHADVTSGYLWLVTSRLGTGKSVIFFLQCTCWRHIRISWLPPGLLHYPPFIPSFYLLKQPFFIHPLHNTSFNIRFLLLEGPPSSRSLMVHIFRIRISSMIFRTRLRIRF